LVGSNLFLFFAAGQASGASFSGLKIFFLLKWKEKSNELTYSTNPWPPELESSINVSSLYKPTGTLYLPVFILINDIFASFLLK